MEKNIEKDQNINNEDKILNENNPFIKFIEDYYGYFKLFISPKNMHQIGKVNKKLMTLRLIDIGNKLYHKKEYKKNKLKKIISVRILININNFFFFYRTMTKIIIKVGKIFL